MPILPPTCTRTATETPCDNGILSWHDQHDIHRCAPLIAFGNVRTETPDGNKRVTKYCVIRDTAGPDFGTVDMLIDREVITAEVTAIEHRYHDGEPHTIVYCD